MSASRELLASVVGSVHGFRAPFFRRRRGHLEAVRRAGYRYDASAGSVWPGPQNGHLASLPCPVRRGPVCEFPTSAMCGGVLPLSLTWLRLLAPTAFRLLPRRPGLLYLHLHEFLPPETAQGLPTPLRHLLTRNCGEPAWDILDRALDRLDGEFATCRELIDGAGTPAAGLNT